MLFFQTVLIFFVLSNGLNYNSTQNLSVRSGGGRNVDDQNVDRPKISERRNGLFSWSERRNQNVENVFLVDQNVENE